jgi:hypothetical protein
MSEAIPTVKLPRDARVDHLGYVNELVSQFANPLKAKVKEDLTKKRIDRAAGDAFECLLVPGSTASIDAEKFLLKWESGKITRAQFLAAISVGKEAALCCLSKDELARISTSKPKASALNVTKIKGVEVTLVEAVRAIEFVMG